MKPTREAAITQVRNREDAESLYIKLRERADAERQRRARVRRLAAAGVTALAVTAAVLVRSVIVGPPPAAAFSSCRQVASPGGVLGLLVRAPGIALIDRAGSATVDPQRVTARCALQGSKLVAIRVSSLIAPYGEVSVETWFRTPPVGSSSPGATINIGKHAVRTRVLGDGAFAVAPSGSGIALVIINGPDVARLMDLGLKLGVATRASTDLASSYDVALSQPATITPHPVSPSKSWSFVVSTREKLGTQLGALGLPLVAVLPDAQPQRVDVFQGEEGLAVKTSYPDAAPGGVRVVQSENSQVETAGGTAVQVRGVAGLEVGSTVYWHEEGYLLAVDAESGNPIEYANAITWTTP